MNQSKAEWAELVDQANDRLVNHEISLDEPGVSRGPVMDLDGKTERFTGVMADKANALLSRSSYRTGFDLPEIG